MIDRQELLEKVRSIIAAELKVDKNIVQESSTFTTLGADSLDLVEVIMRLEEQFNIEISDDEAERLKTVGDVVSFLEKKV